MTDTPTPRQKPPGAVVSAPQGSGGPGVTPECPQGLQGAVQGFGGHDGPTVAELAANDRNWDLQKNGE
ncbi:hypothetical protein ACFYO9_37450 [Streptomyces sp. NPDC005863]|uniref:hypothetical protein n=1 Tax=Streptomyces sp. NPDC005863 TaxID=3364735 RepID=UPI0036C029AE